MDLLGRSNQGLTVVMEAQAVPAAEDGERAEGFQAGGESSQAVPAIDEALIQGQACTLREAVEPGVGVIELSLTGQAESIGEVVQV